MDENKYTDNNDIKHILKPIDQTEPEPDIQVIKPKKKVDSGFRYIIGQILVCSLGLLAVFSIKFTGGDIYNEVKAKYTGIFCQTTTPSQIIATMGEFVARLSNQKQPDKTDVSSAENSASREASSALTSDNAQSDILPKNGNTSSSIIQSSTPLIKPTSLNISAKASSGTVNSMVMPVNGTVSSEFGYRLHPIYDEELMHKGIDFAADYGSDIYCALNGTVEKAEYDSSYGYYIKVRHSGDIVTVYAHCSELLVKEGEAVKKGQVIAKVGSTGDSTGSHLHFEVRYKSFLINPRWLLKLD